MLEDRYELPLSTTSPAARDAYVAGVDALLSAGPGAEAHFARALQADPSFALAQAGLARSRFVVAQLLEAREGIARAREAAAVATPRERSHVHALALAIEGKPVDALAATRAHLAEYPRDAMVLAPATGVFGLIGFSGRQEREPELYDFLRAYAPAYGADWWFESMLAFAACEAGRLDEARALIERSMAGHPRNAHGAHIKAHVLYESGERQGGLDYLRAWLPDYDRQGLMHCHLSWHVAIFALSLGLDDEAWRAYCSAVHPGGAWGPPINVMTDAAAFLWRAELAGRPPRAELWREVHDYAHASFPQPGLAFVDVHLGLACIARGDADGLDALVAELHKRREAGRLAAGGVVPLLLEGLAAYGAGKWERAIELLGRALPETVRIGGSRAQRDLVVKTLAAACLKSGRPADAQALLAGRPG